METISESRVRRGKKMIQIEASESWIEWVDGLAESVGVNRSSMVDLALRAFAADREHTEKAPKR